MQKVVALLHDTEQVVRTFQRTHRWRAAGKVSASLCIHHLLQIITSYKSPPPANRETRVPPRSPTICVLILLLT